MYAVIFKAEINDLDEAYRLTAKKMRDLAVNDYGCIEFHSSFEGTIETAISYWQSLEEITAWKNNVEHQNAQVLGKNKWYKSYTVQIAEVLREYSSL